MPFGRILVEVMDGKVSAVDLRPAAVAGDSSGGSDPLFAAIRADFAAYLGDPRQLPELTIVEQGSDFQRRVWALLRSIPCGEVMTYGDAAKVLGSSARAVGNACRANPTPIIVPCHRIIAQNGLGGFGGAMAGRSLAIKRWLLRHEGVSL